VRKEEVFIVEGLWVGVYGGIVVVAEEEAG